MRSRDLVAAFRNLLVSFRDSFVNPGDLFILFNPTNEININNRLSLQGRAQDPASLGTSLGSSCSSLVEDHRLLPNTSVVQPNS